MIEAALGFGAGSVIRLGLMAGLLAFAESAVGLGFFLPGEAGIVGLTSLADSGGSRLALFGSVVVGAVAGDHLGYALGRHAGPRMATSRVVARLGRRRWAAATTQLDHHGAAAVFTSRLVPVVRTVMPAAAGAAGLGYRRFATASVAGSSVWSALWVGLGSVGGELLQLAT